MCSSRSAKNQIPHEVIFRIRCLATSDALKHRRLAVLTKFHTCPTTAFALNLGNERRRLRNPFIALQYQRAFKFRQFLSGSKVV